MSGTKVQQLSPDGYTRFFFLTDLIQQIYAKTSKKISILDIGGCSEFFGQQLRSSGIDYKLTIIDILDKPDSIKDTYIKGDATQMEFEDNSFDVVVSTDVLEHISKNKKQAFLDEALRVSKDICIIAAPFMTTGVDEVERAANDFNKKLFNVGNQWLEEHLEYGKPNVDMFKKTLESKKIPYYLIGTQNILTWLLNIQINLIDARFDLNKTAHEKVNQFYNQNVLSMNEFNGPTYRQFFVMFTNSELKNKINIKKYEADTDEKLIARYFSMMMSLTADKIEQLERALSESKVSIGELEGQAMYANQRAHLLSTELDRIKASRSYKAARKLGTVKKRVSVILPGTKRSLTSERNSEKMSSGNEDQE